MIATDPVSLQTWLASARSAILVDAYTVVAKNNTVARWIGGDFDFVVPTPTARSFVRGPIIEREKLVQTVGLSVDPLRIGRMTTKDVLGNDVMFGAISLLTAARGGVLRGATLLLERLVFDPETFTPINPAASYKGRWEEFPGTLEIGSMQNGIIRAEALAETVLLDIMMPRDLYQTMCRNQVFDEQCRLSRAAYLVTGSVTGVTADAQGVTVINTGLTQATGYFDGGVIRFTSGPNNGVMRTIKTHANASGQIAVALPWPLAPVIGNTFEVTPGCNRTMSQCQSKFNNLIHYRGEPFIPAPETVT